MYREMKMARAIAEVDGVDLDTLAPGDQDRNRYLIMAEAALSASAYPTETEMMRRIREANGGNHQAPAS